MYCSYQHNQDQKDGKISLDLMVTFATKINVNEFDFPPRNHCYQIVMKNVICSKNIKQSNDINQDIYIVILQWDHLYNYA